jgi:hypothetical protein
MKTYKTVVDTINKGLNGNGKQRRAEFRELQKKFGIENVKRIDNPEARCKRTRVEITIK